MIFGSVFCSIFWGVQGAGGCREVDIRKVQAGWRQAAYLTRKSYKKVSRLKIVQESQPAKNRNLSRLISNLSRLNLSSERNSVYCFSTVFTILQQQEVPYLSTP